MTERSEYKQLVAEFADIFRDNEPAKQLARRAYNSVSDTCRKIYAYMFRNPLESDEDYARYIVGAICEAVIRFRCKENYQREWKMLQADTSITMSYMQVMNSVCNEVRDEATSYFHQLIKEQKQLLSKAEIF